jgi:hypothetical protein
MADRVIPMPHEDEVFTAKFGLEVQAKRFGLDIDDPQLREFLDHEVTVKSQMMAEIRWLRNMMHSVQQATKAA